MSADLFPLAASDWASPYEHLDPADEVLAAPADEQPVSWDEDDLYRDES